MSVTADIIASYRGPRRVIRRLLAMGEREDRALAFLIGGCALVFIAQLPRLSREAHLKEADMGQDLGGTLFAWLFMMPLILYGLAWLSHLVLRAVGRGGRPYGARLALFWALLASGPIMLLWGLVAGFIGPGVQLSLVGALWLGAFLWFWWAGLAEASHGQGA